MIGSARTSDGKPPIYHLSFPTQHLLASTFLRFQEHYESPEFRGKYFSLEEYMDWYAEKTGAFTYYKDWNGFNIPSYVLEPFHAGHFDPLTAKEQLLLDITRLFPEPFYLIGTWTDDSKKRGTGENRTLVHECVHGLYYTFPDYAAAVNEELAKHDTSQVRTALEEMGYHEGVILDEINAYMTTGLKKKIEKRPIIAAALHAVFERKFGYRIDTVNGRETLVESATHLVLLGSAAHMIVDEKTS